MPVKTLSLRIEENLLHKLHIVAHDESRSANGQIIVLIRQCIAAYEAKHGPIPL